MNNLEYEILTEDYKNIKCTEDEKALLKQKINEAFNKKYHAVCLNIGGLLEKDDSLEKELLEEIYKLLKKYIPVVFVTGRGESGLKDFISTLIDELKNNYNISFDLLKNIIGVANNGNFLFYTSGQDEKILDSFYNLTNEEALEKISDFNDELLEEKEEVIGENYITYSYCQSLNGVLNTIRVIVVNENDLEKIEEYIKNKLFDEKYKGFLNYDIGQFKGNIILQIGVSTKGRAVEEIEKFLGIPKDSILRIGSNGQPNGTDYEMLKSPQGFSINNCSPSKEGCFPVFDDNGELLKGTKAIQFLLNKLNIFPTVCLEKPNKEKYIKQLAIAEKNITAGRGKPINAFNMFFNMNFNVTDGINDVFDQKSGGLTFKDWEWEILSDNNKLKQLFESTDEDKYKYILDTDYGKLLRGADTYYFFLANKGKGQNITSKQVFDWWQNNTNFIKEAIYSLKDYRIITMEDKRLLLAVLDNIKNISLLMLNAKMICKYPNENILVPFDSYLKDKEIMEWYNICDSIYETMGSLCFSNKFDEYNVDNLERILNKLAEIYKNGVLDILKRNDENLNNKCFRSYREIDNYIENYIAMDLAIQKSIKENPKILDKGINFTGVAYGGLELPFLAKNILNGDANTSAIILKGKYKDRHMQKDNNENEKLNILNKRQYEDGINILADDNVLTGKTLQIALDILFANGINIDSTAIVRYPSLNRVNQMFFEGHGAIDTTKFLTFIKGLVFPSPYSKLKNASNGNYKDELGIFNKSRDRILRYLYKNGKFTYDSEVAQIDIGQER